MESLLMFVLVNKDNYTDHLDHLKEIENTYYHNDWPEKELSIKGGRTEFLLYNHKEHGVIGGARISKLDEKHRVTKYFNQMGYMIEDFVVAEEVYFHLPDDSPIQEDEDLFETLCVEFYTSLYDALMLQGQLNKKITLITANYEDDHEDIKYFGHWPFVMEHLIPGPDENSELIMGIIPMVDQPALS